MSADSITFTTSVRVPLPPNFLTVEGRFVQQESAGGLLPTIDVKELSDEQLQEIGEKWTKNLIEHARERRAHKAPPTMRSEAIR